MTDLLSKMISADRARSQVENNISLREITQEQINQNIALKLKQDQDKFKQEHYYLSMFNMTQCLTKIKFSEKKEVVCNWMLPKHVQQFKQAGYTTEIQNNKVVVPVLIPEKPNMWSDIVSDTKVILSFPPKQTCYLSSITGLF